MGSDHGICGCKQRVRVQCKCSRHVNPAEITPGVADPTGAVGNTLPAAPEVAFIVGNAPGVPMAEAVGVVAAPTDWLTVDPDACPCGAVI